MLHRGSENHYLSSLLFALKCIDDILLGVACDPQCFIFFIKGQRLLQWRINWDVMKFYGRNYKNKGNRWR